MQMCEDLKKKTAPQYNSNSLNCKKKGDSAYMIAVERLTVAINNSTTNKN